MGGVWFEKRKLSQVLLVLNLDSVVENYEAIFNEHSDDLQDMVDEIGEMFLSMRDDGMAVYELSNSAGTKLYPVIFTWTKMVTGRSLSSKFLVSSLVEQNSGE